MKGMLTSVSVRALGARRAPEAWPRQARRASSSLKASRTLHFSSAAEIVSVGKIRLTLQPAQSIMAARTFNELVNVQAVT